MNIDKKQIQKEIDSLRRNQKIFFILGLSFFGVALALSIAAFVLFFKDVGGDLFFYLAQLGGTMLMVAITMLILRTALFTFRINVRLAMLQGIVTIDEKGQYVPTVDVKPVPEEKVKSKEEELVDQYENLYKQGHISKEDFEKKKKEILEGK